MDGILTETEARSGPDAGRIAAAAAAADSSHYRVEELVELAAARRAATGEWSMPQHLAVCPLCLEIFETLLDGEVEQPAAPALERIVEMGVRECRGGRKGFALLLSLARRPRLRVAAVILAAALSAAFYRFQTGRNPPAVNAGVLVTADARQVRPGAKFPAHAQVRVAEPAEAVLDDGSKVMLARDSCVSFQRNRHGAPVFTLESGSLEADVRPQTQGRAFMVKTDLGSVQVVGTRFAVSRQKEKVFVYETGAGPARTYEDEIDVMRVSVAEGTVLVRNSRERAAVWSGKTAVVRSNHPYIEVQ